MKSKAYDGVSFDFFSQGDDHRSLTGTIIMREDAMVLEIELPGDDPYTVLGKPSGHYYIGHHVGAPDHTKVDAKWAGVGDRAYVGSWIEDGEDWLFRFRLPEKHRPANSQR